MPTFNSDSESFTVTNISTPVDRYTNATPRKKIYGKADVGLLKLRTKTTMEEHTIDIWFLREAESRISENRLGEIYEGSALDMQVNDTAGKDAIKLAVLTRASERISSRINNRGESCVTAFNDVTNSWPIRAQAMLAAYEVDRKSDERDNQYIEYAENFVEHEGVTLDFDESTPDNLSYSLNPYDELVRELARIVLMLRVDERVDNEDIHDYINEIESPRQFQEIFSETGDVDSAIHAQNYEDIIPYEILPMLAPPEEWEHDPQDIISGRCNFCHDELYWVTHENGQGWLNEFGDIIDFFYSTEGYSPERTDSVLTTIGDGPTSTYSLCQECYNEEFLNDCYELAHVTDNGDIEIIRVRDNIAEIAARHNDDYIEPSDEMLNTVNDIISGTDEYIELPPLEVADSPLTPQQELMFNILNGSMAPEILRGRDIFLCSEPSGEVKMIPNKQVGNAQAAKETLNNANEMLYV